MSEETNYNEHNEVKYERILRRQCKSLENMYTSYKYHPYHCAQVSKDTWECQVIRNGWES